MLLWHFLPHQDNPNNQISGQKQECKKDDHSNNHTHPSTRNHTQREKEKLVVVCRVGCDYKQKNMGKKVKSEECSGRWCTRHLFSIKPFFIPNEQTKQDTLRLCPKMNKTTKRMDCLLPQLNRDNKFYTPLFTLQENRVLYVDYDVKNRQSFLESQRQQEYQISQIVTPFRQLHNYPFFPSFLTQMVPKQSSSKKYCKVCKEDFADYLQHIQSPTHLQKSRSNRFSGYIAELHDRFQHSPQNGSELKNMEELKPIIEDFMKSEDSTLPVQARNKPFPLLRETVMSLPFLGQPSVEEVKVW